MVGIVDLKRFETPDEVRVFEKGRLAVVKAGGMALGRAEYEPGWKWSLHVGPTVGASRLASSTWASSSRGRRPSPSRTAG